MAVIDVGLPGLNGYEIARRFRAEAPDADEVMLVALTGYGTPEARERSRWAGFDHHFIKPVNAETLQKIMRAVGASAPAPASAGRAAVDGTADSTDAAEGVDAAQGGGAARASREATVAASVSAAVAVAGARRG